MPSIHFQATVTEDGTLTVPSTVRSTLATLAGGCVAVSIELPGGQGLPPEGSVTRSLMGIAGSLSPEQQERFQELYEEAMVERLRKKLP